MSLATLPVASMQAGSNCKGVGINVGHVTSISCRVPGAQPLWLPAGLLKGIEGRAELAAEYAQLLADCQQIYCDTRLLLVVPVVQQHILDSSAEPLPTLMRQGCAYLIQVGVSRVGPVRPVQRPAAAFCSWRLNPTLVGTRPGLAWLVATAGTPDLFVCAAASCMEAWGLLQGYDLGAVPGHSEYQAVCEHVPVVASQPRCSTLACS